MNGNPLFTLIISLSFILNVAFAFESSIYNKGFYGDDNRRLVSELADVRQRVQVNQSRSVLAQIPKWRVFSEDSEEIHLLTKSLTTGMNFCSDEKFSDLPIVSSCSAFLVGPDLMLTAAHCLREQSDCSKNYWALDYDSAVDFENFSGKISFKREKLVSCLKVISFSNDSQLDYALIQIDRKLTDRTPLKLRRWGKISSRDILHVIGHPMGLPKIIATEGRVVGNALAPFFLANTDTFSGNSGSPVINSRTQRVEGILTKGGADLQMDLEHNCNRSFHCQGQECRGESVLRSTELPLGQIPSI